MHIAEFSVRQPVFIVSVAFALLLTGALFYPRFPVDMLPNNQFPLVRVVVAYPGAGPRECEEQLAKPLEELFSGIQGARHVRSISHEGFAAVMTEFSMEMDLRHAKDLVQEKAMAARVKFPPEALEPLVQAFNPTEQPVMLIAMESGLGEGDAFAFADRRVRPTLEQVASVAQVEILGSRKREVVVELDREALKAGGVSASEVCRSLQMDGRNVPAGKFKEGARQTLFRTLGEFANLDDIRKSVVRFVGNEVPVTLGEIAKVEERLVEEKTRSYLDGKPVLLLSVQRQSGANTMAVAEALGAAVARLDAELASAPGSPRLTVVRDQSRMIRDNVADVKESIFLGILLTVLVVWFFLGSAKATLVTALALPTSLLGAFIPMHLMGFSINLVTLLALSLTVGLLIDDAIVVRENIFRLAESGMGAREASILGTRQVSLAVVATTLVVLSVFGPIAFTQGLVGQFLKEFGLTVCFAMAISLFDSLTIAPMLSAYFIGVGHEARRGGPARLLAAVQRASTRAQDAAERFYLVLLRKALGAPKTWLAVVIACFLGSLAVAWLWVPRTFLSPSDNGQFPVYLETPPGTSLSGTGALARRVEDALHAMPEVRRTVLTVGTSEGEANRAVLFVDLVPRGERRENTSAFMERVRERLRLFPEAHPVVKDETPIGSTELSPFNLSLYGEDWEALCAAGVDLTNRLAACPSLRDISLSLRDGAPELQVQFDRERAKEAGVTSETLGLELRAQIEGVVSARYRQGGVDTDIRVRMRDEERDLRRSYGDIWVPNLNGRLVPVSKVTRATLTNGISTLYREDRNRALTITAELAPKGGGLGAAKAYAMGLLVGDAQRPAILPKGVRHQFTGMVTNYDELVWNMALALILGIAFMYLVLASLYKSFVTPFSIIAVLPLAATGGVLALALFQKPLDAFTMIGGILLMGVATKNSILLIDRALQALEEGRTHLEALLEAGRARFRPILMTSIALITGMIPVAVGLNEASSQRTGMGILLIGGLVSSTLLSLLIIPVCFLLIERLRGKDRRTSPVAVPEKT